MPIVVFVDPGCSFGKQSSDQNKSRSSQYLVRCALKDIGDANVDSPPANTDLVSDSCVRIEPDFYVRQGMIVTELAEGIAEMIAEVVRWL
ncbi:MAG: hypothetical protein QOJ64_48 [Acidobacteriota bacterium]|nr:hypothetical protein [Acidobacteriota bacterium]